MTTRKFLRLWLWLVLAFFANSAWAAFTTWDPQGTNGGIIINPTNGGYTGNLSGTWETASWSTSTSETGQSVPTNWVENTACVIACQANGNTPAFTITMNSNHTVAGIFDGSLIPDPCPVTINGTGSIILPASTVQGVSCNSDTGDPGTLTINVPITGAAVAAIEGNGSIYLHGTNTYSGGTYLGAGPTFFGILYFSNSAAFGTGGIYFTNLRGGAMVLEGNAPVTITNPVIQYQTIAARLNIVGNPAGLTFSGPWTMSGAVSNAGPVSIGSGNVTNNLVTISGVISGTNNISKVGVGILALSATNTYSGTTTISNGTLALTATGSINNSPQISILTNSTLDVSAYSYFALSPNTTLAASGTSDVVGAGAAVINGSPGGTVSLGSQPINLAFNGYASEPELFISQGTLSLNGNSFTVYNPFGQLNFGSFLLIEQAGGSIASSGSYSVSVTGNGVVAGGTPSIEVSGNYLYLVVKETPSFSNLSSSQSITYGTTNITLGGKLSGSGPMFPSIGETITVTINGNAQATTVSGNQGDFSINYNPSTIPAIAAPGSYVITYSYAGDSSLTAATDTSTTLSVNQLPVILTGSRVYDGTATAAAAILSVANRVGSDSVTVSGGSANLGGTNVGAQSIASFGSLTLGGAAATNYTLVGASGSVTITAASLSITANNDTKIYGQTKTYGAGSTAFTSSPLQNGETVGSVTITASGGTAANAPVGVYNLIPSAATGGTFNPNNYNISYFDGTLTVIPRTNSWIVLTGGKWETATNWLLGMPDLTDYFDFITNSGTKTITIDATTTGSYSNTLTVTNLAIGASSGSLNTLLLSNAGTNTPLHVISNLTVLPGGSLIMSNSSLLVDNSGGTATLTLNGSSLTRSGGTFQADNLILTNGGNLITLSNFVVGSTNGVTNTATITGGSTLTFSNSVFGIGNSGSISNGSGIGVVTVTNGTINASTIDIGSTAGGSGTLTVQSNGVVNVTSNLSVVSSSPTTTSSVAVTGGSLTASNGVIQIGTVGTGLMTISSGAVTAQTIQLGSSAPGSDGTLTMNGNSYLRVTSLLSVNSLTSFDLPGINIVVDGTESTLNVGDDAAGKMTLTSPSASQTWNNINIGYNATGTYIQSAGQTVVNNSMIVGNCVDSGPVVAGYVTLSGGMFSVANGAHTAELVVRNGTFVLENGATLVADNLIITDPCAQFQNNGGTLSVNPANITLAPNLDTDGDGVPNWAEWAAGTDPLNPSSYFHIISVTVSGPDVLVTWSSVVGKNYVVQVSNTKPASASFADLSGVVPATNNPNNQTTFRHAGGAGQSVRYYRVRLSQ